jgi:hypothetical protein
MGDKQTIVDIKTRYDGRGAAAAKQDVQSLSTASAGGMKTEAAATDQLKQKADALGTSTKELTKGKIALNATTLILRGSFREAAQQLDKLGGAWKVFAGTVAGSMALLGALVAIITTLIAKWKDHQAAIAETDKQVKALNWARLQEALDLDYDKGRKALSEWVDDLQKAEAQAKSTAAALLLVKAAQEDADMARIDLKESQGQLTKTEAQQQRNSLSRRRELDAVERERNNALNDTQSQQEVESSASEQIDKLWSTQALSGAAAKKKISSLSERGIIDDGAAGDLNRIIERGGTIDDARLEQVKKGAEARATARAKSEAEANVMKDMKANPQLSSEAYSFLLQDETSKLTNKYKTEAVSGIDSAVSEASMAGRKNKAAQEQIPVLQGQVDSARQKLLFNQETLKSIPLKRQAINEKYQALDEPLYRSTPAYIAANAENTLNNGGTMEFPGRRDNTGQVVSGGGEAQAARARQLVQRAQELVVGGSDDAAVAERLAQLLNQLGVKIKTDKQTFYNLVDQLDGVANEIGDLKAREKANKAGE